MNKIKKIMKILLVAVIVGTSALASNSTVKAVEPNTDSLIMDKVARDNGDGTYTLQLSAYTEGKVSIVTKTKPLDIVLVLDQSGSMTERIGSVYYEAFYNNTGNGHGVFETDAEMYAYFIKRNNKFIRVIYTKDDKAGGRFPIYKDAEGNAYVPMTPSGKPIESSDKWETVQFYRGLPDENTPRKIEVLKESAKSFVDGVIGDGGDHRIAVVGYASGEKEETSTETPYVNTELFIGSQQYSQNGKLVSGGNSGVQHPGIEAMYSQAFQSTKDTTGKNNIKNSLNALSANGATRADLGMDMANNIFSKDPNNDKNRQKVVIMFTDGSPTSTNFFDPAVANATISFAKQMKTAGAMVFTVGVENTLDTSANPELSSTSSINRYMQYVSSNYPNATSLDNPGTDGDFNNKKFLSADDEASLKQVFKTINEEISTSTSTLDMETELVDYISDQFKPTDVDAIKVYTQNYLGNKQWDSTLHPYEKAVVNYDEHDKSITVTGFDYSEEYIADTTPVRGRRLVVEVKVKANDDFIGGNAINTNKEESGIYDDGALIKPFPKPLVDVPLNFQPLANSQGIYIGSNLNHLTCLFDADTTASGIQFKNKANQVYTIDSINNKFVEIKHEVKIDGAVVATYTIGAGKIIGSWDTNLDFSSLIADKNIEINTIITPITTGSVTNQQNTNPATIYVYKPQVTVKDEIIFLGEKSNLDNSVTNVEWTNENVDAVKPEGEAPTLSYEYVSKDGTLVRDNNEEYSIIEDVDLTMVVKNGEKIITDHTTIINAAQHQGIDLKVQVVKGQLTINKTIDAQYTNNATLKANQSFVFKVDVRNEIDGDIIDSYYQTISFSANEGLTNKSVTLKGLQKGYYTISEVSDWSWKYTENILGRKDNYIGNGMYKGLNENTNILIGDRDIINAGEGNMFYGCQEGTTINGKVQNSQSVVNFINNIKDTNILGDNASAINKFKGN